MINLSQKAARRFHFKWNELEEQHGDCWKIDVIMVSRTPVLFIIHEYTLYTLVRDKKELRKIEEVVDEIRRCCPWYWNDRPLAVGKNSDRKLNGSINEMKRITGGIYSCNSTEEMEERINTCLFSALSKEKYDYGTPIEAVEKYARGEWP
jgi:hypothetical protein